jgi:PIN domain nuclease of toxin-antitoxin system
MPVVLDASALLAMLKGEPGGDAVATILDDTAIATVNFAEIVGFYARRGSTEEEIRRLLVSLPTVRHQFDEELAYQVGLMVPATASAGLSFGDRACLALARRLGAKVLTADRAWLRIAAAVDLEIELIR